MKRNRRYSAPILSVIIVALIVKMQAGPRFNPNGSTLTVSGIALGQSRFAIEKQWLRGQSAQFCDYTPYFRGEWGHDRESVDVRYDQDDQAVSVVGHRFEQDGVILVDYGAKKADVFRTFRMPITIDNRLFFGIPECQAGVGFRCRFSETFLGWHMSGETTPEDARASWFFLGEVPEDYLRPGRHRKNKKRTKDTVKPRLDHDCDSLPNCGPHVLQR